MRTKYVMTNSGLWIVFNEASAFQHYDAASFIADGSGWAGAGHLSPGIGRDLSSYGMSIGMDIKSRGEDAEIIKRDLAAKEFHVFQRGLNHLAIKRGGFEGNPDEEAFWSIFEEGE